SSAPLEVEHEFVGTGLAHHPRVAAVALRAAVETDQLGLADLHEFKVPADLCGAERPCLDIGERTADSLGPERMALGRANSVGRNGDRPHRQLFPWSWLTVAQRRPGWQDRKAGSLVQDVPAEWA